MVVDGVRDRCTVSAPWSPGKSDSCSRVDSVVRVQELDAGRPTYAPPPDPSGATGALLVLFRPRFLDIEPSKFDQSNLSIVVDI